jgi:hypothetical protein
MIGATSTYLITLLLALINFCDNTYQKVKAITNNFVNNNLDGYVIYYALYSTEDKNCSVLYDYRGFWQRVYLLLYKLVLQFFYDLDLVYTGRLFKYENVIDNVDNLSCFFVDCAVVSYVQNQQIHHELLTSEDMPASPSTSEIPKFVFAVFNDGNEDHDFTYTFNLFRKGIIACKKMKCLDIMIVLCKFHQNNSIDLSDFTLKCMLDNTFNEIVFKDNDTISSKISS